MLVFVNWLRWCEHSLLFYAFDEVADS
jgi:hypothetical protein